MISPAPLSGTAVNTHTTELLNALFRWKPEKHLRHPEASDAYHKMRSRESNRSVLSLSKKKWNKHRCVRRTRLKFQRFSFQFTLRNIMSTVLPKKVHLHDDDIAHNSSHVHIVPVDGSSSRRHVTCDIICAGCGCVLACERGVHTHTDARSARIKLVDAGQIVLHTHSAL
jgi:hypothetical protein